jgi:hypothetical protein
LCVGNALGTRHGIVPRQLNDASGERVKSPAGRSQWLGEDKAMPV